MTLPPALALLDALATAVRTKSGPEGVTEILRPLVDLSFAETVDQAAEDLACASIVEAIRGGTTREAMMLVGLVIHEAGMASLDALQRQLADASQAPGIVEALVATIAGWPEEKRAYAASMVRTLAVALEGT